MGTFSDQAVGFFLQLEDQLSPTLGKAVKNYGKGVAQLDKANALAFRSANKGLSQYAAIVDVIVGMPKKAAAAFKATAKIADRFSGGGGKGSKAAEIRLSPTMPKSRSKFFDTSVPLRKSFKSQVQPPDFVGKLHGLPKFAKGGVVPPVGSPFPPPPGTTDDVLAWLTPGEVVLPKGFASTMDALVKEGEASAPLVAATAEEVFKLTTALDKLEKVASSGQATAEQMDVYNSGVTRLDAAIDGLTSASEKLSKKGLAKVSPFLDKATKSVAKFGDEVEVTSDRVEEMFQKTLKQERFQSLMLAARGLQGDMGGLNDTDGPTSLIDNLNDLNQVLNVSRDSLSRIKVGLATAAADGRTNLGMAGAAAKGLAESGVRAEESLIALAPLAAKFAQATGQDAAVSGQRVGELATRYKMTGNEIARVLAVNKGLAEQSRLSHEQLDQVFQSSSVNAGGFFVSLGDQADDAMSNFQRFAAGLSNVIGAEATTPFMDQIARAMGGDQQAASQVDNLLHTMGLSLDQFQRALTDKDGMKQFEHGMSNLGAAAESAMAGITDPRARALQAASFGESMGLTEASAASLEQLARAGRGAGAEMTRAIAPVDGLTDGMAALNTGVDNTTTFFGKMRNQVTAFLTQHGGAELMDFFKEINPMVLLSAGYFVKMAGGVLMSGVALAGKLIPALGTALTSLTGMGRVAATTGATAGVGVGGFLKGLGTGLGALANPKAILGIAVITGGVIGLGYAAKLAAPFISEVMDGMVETVGIFKEMSPQQILATAGALVVFGPSLAGIGIGAAAMGAGLLLAIPGLAAFAGISGMLAPGAQGGAALIGSTVTAIAEAFQVDPAQLDRANAALGGSITLLGGLVGAGAVLAGITMVSLSPIGLLTSFFASSIVKKLSSDARDITATVVGIAMGLSGLSNPSTLDKIESTSESVAVVAAFASDYAKITNSIEMAAPKTGVWEWATSLFSGSDITKLGPAAAGIVEVVKSLAGSLGSEGFATDATTLSGSLKSMRAVADFTDDFAFTGRMMSDLADEYDNFRGINATMKSAKDLGLLAVPAVIEIAAAFAKEDASAFAKATDTIGASRAFVEQLSGVLWWLGGEQGVAVNLEKVMESWDSLETWSDGQGKFGGGPLPKIANSLKVTSQLFASHKPDVAAMQAWGTWIDCFAAGIAKLATIGADASQLDNVAKVSGALAENIQQLRAPTISAAEVEAVRTMVIEVMGENSALQREMHQAVLILGGIYSKISGATPAAAPVIQLGRAPGISQDTLLFGQYGQR